MGKKIKLLTVSEAIEENGLKILVHAPSGAGKTVLCATPGEPTIIISAEAGLRSLKKYAKMYPKEFEQIKIIKIQSYKQLKRAYNFVAKKKIRKMFVWLNLDSISEIADVILAYEKKHNKDARKAYGELFDKVMDLLRKFRNLPYDVCMTAKQQYTTDSDTGRMMYFPLFPGQKLQQEVEYMFDEVFALRVERDEDDEEDYRVLQTGRDYKYGCKDRSGVLDMFEEPNLYKIKKKIEQFKINKNRKKKRGKKGKKNKSKK